MQWKIVKYFSIGFLTLFRQKEGHCLPQGWCSVIFEFKKRILTVNRKLGDGLFINVCKQVSQNFPQIEYAEEQVDTMCMRLARNPQEVDVMVMPNLYGDIVSDLCAGNLVWNFF